MRHKAVFGTLILGTLLWAAGCNRPGPTTNPSVTNTSEGPTTEASAGTVAAQEGKALVRVVNVASPTIDVRASLAPDQVFSNIPYKTITPYTEMLRGEMQFRVSAEGDKEDLGARVVELVPGRHYTLVALPEREGDLGLMLLNDKLAAVDPGETRVRLINATTGGEDLDLFIAGTNDRVLHGIEAGTRVITSFADMYPGTVEIRSPERPAPTLLTNLKVEPEHLYTFIVIGRPGDLDVVRIDDRTES